MQEDVDNISGWLKLNKLTLNISNSDTMLVGTGQKLRGESELRISIDDEVLSDLTKPHTWDSFYAVIYHGLTIF